MNMPLLLQLFIRFLKVGIVGFGGGWAMIPIIQREIVEEAGWLTSEEFANVIAIAGSTPGPISVNAATFVGFKIAGVVGALVATTAVILPPFTIISLIVYSIGKYMSSKYVAATLNGLKAAVLGLIVLALIATGKEIIDIKNLATIKNFISLTIALTVILAVYVFKIHPIYAIVAAAVIGITLGFLGIW
jgi:chromate transporter